MGSTSANKEILKEIPSLIRVYRDGSVERFWNLTLVPPCSDPDPETGVISKDVIISQNPHISARLYLPKTVPSSTQKLTVLVYFHGGAFCVESAFSFFNHRYLNNLVSQAEIVAVSVEYRLAPEHPLPIGYEDCWAALQWVASHSSAAIQGNPEPWLLNHVDFRKVFIGGDSAGGNMVHNIALRAGAEALNCGVKILGGIVGYPYFWGSEAIGSESSKDHEESLSSLLWEIVYPSAPGGIDNAMVNPVGPGKPSLVALGCSRLLVCVAEKDQLRDRGVWYYEAVKESGWGGELELYEARGEGHGFHIINLQTENAKTLMKKLVHFLLK